MIQRLGAIGGGCLASVACVSCGSVKSTPDAGVTADAALVDAAPAACGDGRRDPGEVCFATAIIVTSTDVTYDAHLADQDGDGDLDLVYLIGDEYKFHLQNQGQFAPVAVNGPTTFGRFAASIDLGGSPRLELIDAGDGAISTWGVGTGQNGYASLGMTNQTGQVRAMAIANVTGGATPNVIALYGTTIVVGTFNAQLQLTSANGSSPNNARSLVAGRIDADNLADIAVAAGGGVLVFRGGALNQTVTTAQQAQTDAVALGDIDHDQIVDIGFAVAGVNGQLGVLRGVGGAAFLAPTTQTVANLGPVLASADIDGDGLADLIGARTAAGAHAVLVALGQPDGSVGVPTALPIATAANYVRVDGDFNNDGVPDIVVTDTNNQTVVVLPSNP